VKNEDFLEYLELEQEQCSKSTVVFLSPPWGGPEYIWEEFFDVHTCITPAFERILRQAS
jgi:hypothetical protein